MTSIANKDQHDALLFRTCERKLRLTEISHGKSYESNDDPPIRNRRLVWSFEGAMVLALYCIREKRRVRAQKGCLPCCLFGHPICLPNDSTRSLASAVRTKPTSDYLRRYIIPQHKK